MEAAMLKNIYLHATEHHQELLRVARQARLAHSAGGASPGLKDRLYLRLGDFFVTLGEKLREESLLFEGGTELAVREFSHEYL
jgi:hypothetical protein